MRWSIKAVLIGTVVGLQVATVAAILFSSMVTSREALLGHARQIMEGVAVNVRDRSLYFLRPAQAAADLTQRLANAEVVSSADPASLERYFYESLRGNPQFAGIYFGSVDGGFYYVNRSADRTPGGYRTKLITFPEGGRQVSLRWRDKDWQVVDEARDDQDAYDPRLRPWFRKAFAEKGLIWTDPYVFFTSRQPGITVAAPVMDRKGTILGVVGVDIEIIDISAFLDQIRKTTGSSAFIVNRNGDVIAHPDPDKISKPADDVAGGLRFTRIDELDDLVSRAAVRSLGRPLTALEPSTDAVFTSFEADGETYHAAFSAMASRLWPWLIGVHAPETLYLGVLKDNQTRNIYIALVVGAISILVGLLVARAVARPIAQLRADAQAVTAGAFPRRDMPLPTQFAELHETAEAFHKMLASVQQAKGDLERANEALEQRVDQRTRALREEIEERKRISEALRIAKEQADEANRAKSRFLSSMSHELRTPMNAIIGFGQLLKLDEDSLPAEHRDWVDHIVRSGHHLLDLINQVLDLAKVEAGSVGMSIEEVRPEQVIDECLPLARILAAKRGITLAVEPLPDTLPLVRADFTRLKQALLNLLSNAIKYNHDNGEVRLRVLLMEEGLLRLEVSDTGVGIAEAERPLLFQPFSRLSATRDLVEGTGIGLAITKQLVEMMSGKIGFDSVAGRGSTFWLEMPSGARRRRPGHVAEPETAAPVVALPPAATVLYVEDNPANVKLMEQIVARHGCCRLLAARTAEQGLEMIRLHQPDLVLMDINLPGMDGYTALAELRRDPATRAIPVIALTANALSSDRERAVAAGFDAYVAKPLDVREILAAMNGALAA